MSTQLTSNATDQGSPPIPRPLASVKDHRLPSSAPRRSTTSSNGSATGYTREQISVVDLKARVGGYHRQFDGARLRRFVAILVEGSCPPLDCRARTRSRGVLTRLAARPLADRDESGQVDQARGVARFVVVPAEDLDHAA